VCTVRAAPGAPLAVVHFDDPEPLDAARFAVSLFGDRSYAIVGSARGWSIVAGDAVGEATTIAFRDAAAVAPRETEWQPLLGNLAFSRVLRLQRGVGFLHAASVVVAGGGALLCGPKGAGKTTLSTALAARGHGFLGDEISAVRLTTRELLPFRRAIAIRDGPRAVAVDAALERDPSPVFERYPDGLPRRRATPRDLFPGAPATGAPLRAVFVLRSLGGTARAERFTPAPTDVSALGPLASSLWTLPAGVRVVKFGALLSGSACYHLDAGTPDETTALVERVMEDVCH
jgi:hypothetical protein